MANDASALRGNWSYPTSIRFGVGRIGELPDACKQLGFKHPLLVTDPGLAKLPMIQEAIARNEAAGLKTGLFSAIKGNPISKNVEDGLKVFRTGGYDGIIAFGGGSALDAAKTRADAENAAILASDIGQRVIGAFAARAMAEPGPITAERFKALMNEVKAETGAKGKELFHPVRIVLTGAHSGPEFDKIIPLFEDGSALGLGVKSVAERAAAFFLAD